ncbi:helix-turn-helix domain-containing protein [Pusillimonas sp.]|uniref:AraC-like ligand-binding domain-containing protein n=1 Tax=Pusillimonas sp. TaxID=3040095 RepID=UPI0037CA87E8
MHRRYSTDDVPENQRFDYWQDAVCDALFKLRLSAHKKAGFRGQIDRWNFTTSELLRISSDAVKSQRLRKDCDGEDRHILLTLPVSGNVTFSQLGRTANCVAGQSVLELSEEAYDHAYDDGSNMWVLKMPAEAVRLRMSNPRRFIARNFNMQEGVARLFSDYLKLVLYACQTNAVEAYPQMGAHLIDLLAIGLQNHPDALQSQSTAVKDAHLLRIESYVRTHLTDPDLSPGSIAQGCGISVRYLHTLFQDTDESVSSWIRNQRLQYANEALQQAGKFTTVAQVAYAAGFTDQSQLTRAFKRRYRRLPSDVLNAARKPQAGLQA